MAVRVGRPGQPAATHHFGGQQDQTSPNCANLWSRRTAHRHGTADDLVVGFPTDAFRPLLPSQPPSNSNRAWHTAIQFLTPAFKSQAIPRPSAIQEIRALIGDYVRSARIAQEAGADFIDIKHCHGYLLHEFLSAFARPGDYGGSFENRTRILREIVQGIRADGNPIDLCVRLSAFDTVPFKPDPTRPNPGSSAQGFQKMFGASLPLALSACDPLDPLHKTSRRPLRFAQLCADLGIKS